VTGHPSAAVVEGDGSYAPFGRTTATRHRERVRYDRETVHAVLDEALLCSVGFVVEGGPVVLPMLQARVGETLYLHGSTGSWMRGAAADGTEVCVTVTVVDGLVLARSAFHHSINYRSVVLFGPVREVSEAQEKAAALTAVVEHALRGRSEEVRGPNPRELAATSVLAVELAEVSAKVRTGPPVDDEEDLSAPTWAGVLPVVTGYGVPVPAPELPAGAALPDSLTGLHQS